MKKIINDPHDVVPEMVNGMTRAYPQYIEKIEGTEAVVRSDKDSMKGKVGIVSGGGSGHEPTHAGYVGAIGVGATAVTAVKDTPKALRLLESAKEEKGEELTKLETIKVAGPVYIPSIILGASTIGCIVGANILNKRQQAALMSAYALLDNSYKDYKKKSQELYGDDADIQIKKSIAEDKYKEADIVVDDNKQLFYDDFSGRYFESTMEDVIWAEYELNRTVSIYGGVYLNDFYDFLNIPTTDYGNYLGWSADSLSEMYWSSWVDFEHVKTVMDDGLECYIIVMRYEPVPDFNDY